MTKSATHSDHLPAALVEGYRSFANGRLKRDKETFRQLSEKGQKPPVLLIGCCDSRVAPELVFDAGPGEIFVVRNVANLVPPFDADDALPETSAAIEYAVLALNVAHIVVMGHEKCGGVRAYAQGEAGDFEPLSKANFVAKWKSLVGPAAKEVGPPTGDFDRYCEDLCHASIVQGLESLRSYPWVREREASGKLTLHGAYFQIGEGKVTVFDRKTGGFVPVGASPDTPVA